MKNNERIFFEDLRDIFFMIFTAMLALLCFILLAGFIITACVPPQKVIVTSDNYTTESLTLGVFNSTECKDGVLIYSSNNGVFQYKGTDNKLVLCKIVK